MSPVYEKGPVVAYEVKSGGDFETVCAKCLQNNDKVERVYDEDDRDHNNLLIICDRCYEKC